MRGKPEPSGLFASAPFVYLINVTRGTGGVQFVEPESCAVTPPSAVASATGFDCSWHAAAGVVTVDCTVTVTEPPGAMLPSEQLSALPAIGFTHVPCGVDAVCHTRPPALGSWSVSLTLFAGAAPGLLTLMENDTCAPAANVPFFGSFSTLSCGCAHDTLMRTGPAELFVLSRSLAAVTVAVLSRAGQFCMLVVAETTTVRVVPAGSFPNEHVITLALIEHAAASAPPTVQARLPGSVSLRTTLYASSGPFDVTVSV
jgi:hypothetical protein